MVAICGPKSSPVSAAALAADPLLDFREDDGRWLIADRTDGTRYLSPLDDGQDDRDIAYVGRLPVAGGGTMLLIAGVHALGSVGAVDYLTGHAAELYRQVGEGTFSMITASRHDGERVLGGGWIEETEAAALAA